MNIFDISWPISSVTTGYKDRHVVKIEEKKNFDKNGVRDSEIHLSAHTGTHVDAPSHFLRDGKTIDQVTIDRLLGRCKVLDLMEVTNCITSEHLAQHESQIIEGDIILFKTANSVHQITDKFNPHFVYLHESGARYLSEKKVKAVGIDYLGIEHSQPDHATHTTLMNEDIAIIEGLRLGHVPAGTYFLVCLPLYLLGTEAAPARAILMSE